jgi:glycosyltransferase involved in cell wall biosynthesis
MEYMSEGVPVIVSKTRVDSHYFNDSIVRFFESGNEAALAEAMLSLMTDHAAREKLVQNANEFVAYNNWEVRKAEYLQLVDSLICPPRSETALTEPSPVRR